MSDPTIRDEARAALADWEATGLDSAWAPSRIARLEAALRALLDETKPTPDEREALRRAVASVLWNASNYPGPVQARLLGQSVAPLVAKVTEAILASDVWRNRRRPPITDAMVEAVFDEYVCGQHADPREAMRAALEAALATPADTTGEQ